MLGNGNGYFRANETMNTCLSDELDRLTEAFNFTPDSIFVDNFSEPQFPDYDQQHKLGSNAACTSINTEIDSGGISPASSESGIDLSPLIYLEEQCADLTRQGEQLLNFASPSDMQNQEDQIALHSEPVVDVSRLVPVTLQTDKPPLLAKPQLLCFVPSNQVQPENVTAHSPHIAVTPQKSETYIQTACMFKNLLKDSAFSQEFEKRMEIRRYKNRVAAQRSRIRKRDQFAQLNMEIAKKNAMISQLSAENLALKDENAILMQKLNALQHENEALKTKKGYGKATLASLFAVVFCLTLCGSKFPVMEPLNSDLGDAKIDLKKAEFVFTHHGRVALSVDTDLNNEENGSSAELEAQQNNSTPDNKVNCIEAVRKYWNQTEAMQLNNDVQDWVDRHESLMLLQIQKTFRIPLQKLRDKTNKEKAKRVDNSVYVTEKQKAYFKRSRQDKVEDARLKAARERSWRHIDMISNTNKQKLKDPESLGQNNNFPEWFTRDTGLFVPSNIELQYMELLKTFKQREDTLYFMSMKDYYLLPAVDRNGTERPLLTLILPAFSYNGTVPNQISMMRLECEVIGTGLFHIPESILPAFHYQPCK
ncbi:unnamed protein product [Dracunculus medinensis]|uniref:BZIP domain-containing protein n=1 Tax=Dracunculus medinensis TaxID=318479 RepID=A0A158Q4U0_DRAME|nr:unnamed protein product [Dracunculus medinensis]